MPNVANIALACIALFIATYSVLAVVLAWLARADFSDTLASHSEWLDTLEGARLVGVVSGKREKRASVRPSMARPIIASVVARQRLGYRAPKPTLTIASAWLGDSFDTEDREIVITLARDYCALLLPRGSHSPGNARLLAA